MEVATAVEVVTEEAVATAVEVVTEEAVEVMLAETAAALVVA